MDDLSSLKERVEQHRHDLAAACGSGTSGVRLGERNASFLERVISEAFDQALASVPRRYPLLLAAVGTFGRGAVAVRSDADIRFITKSDKKALEQAGVVAERVLYPLWDATLSIGHQVTSVSEMGELCGDDLATATTLLDIRPLAGDVALLSQVRELGLSELSAESRIARFVERLEVETEQRRKRYGDSVYLLEPDVKNGVGGLRDLDIARWAVQARFRISPIGAFSELVALGVLVGREAKEIAEAEEYLWVLRNRLHLHAGRRTDRLTFEEQEQIGVELGFGTDRAEAAERLMQNYYLHARALTRAHERLLERAKPPPRRRNRTVSDLAPGVFAYDGHATVAGSKELMADPALSFRLYLSAVRAGIPVAPHTRELISRASADPSFGPSLCRCPEAAELFLALVCTVAEAAFRGGSILSELNQVGLLLAMLPEFAPVVGHVHHDIYHVYTVDVHSVAAVDALRQMARGELAAKLPLASRLAAEIASPRALFVATLLHDVGKGYPDERGSRKNHSETGAVVCKPILARLGLTPDEQNEVVALIREHLTMYHVATRRDLEDPDTIREFAERVQSRERLRNLYLLTVADVSTTAPTAMTSWKARMFEELYFLTDAFLGGARHEVDESRHATLRAKALAHWTGDAQWMESFLDSMPPRYLLANDAEAITAHARVALSSGDAHVYADCYPSMRHAGHYELCVVAEDRPGLLARVAAAITAARLEVLTAQVYSRTLSSGAIQAVDLFLVKDRRDGSLDAGEMDRLRRELARACATGGSPEDLMRPPGATSSKWGERPSPKVMTEVVLDNRASATFTVVEVFAKDRPGLLYTLARTMERADLTIGLSKINTEGARVADVFYVRELDGRKIEAPERLRALRDALVAAIDGPQVPGP